MADADSMRHIGLCILPYRDYSHEVPFSEVTPNPVTGAMASMGKGTNAVYDGFQYGDHVQI